MKAYIAGPFFNEDQIRVVDTVADTCKRLCIDVYNPKEECTFIPGETSPRDIFNSNIDALIGCDFAIVITDGKDAGTMFEAGYAFATATPIVYLWIHHDGKSKFNIMLNESANAVCRSYKELVDVLHTYTIVGFPLIVETSLKYEDLI